MHENVHPGYYEFNLMIHGASGILTAVLSAQPAAASTLFYLRDISDAVSWTMDRPHLGGSNAELQGFPFDKGGNGRCSSEKQQ